VTKLHHNNKNTAPHSLLNQYSWLCTYLLSLIEYNQKNNWYPSPKNLRKRNPIKKPPTKRITIIIKKKWLAWMENATKCKYNVSQNKALAQNTISVQPKKILRSRARSTDFSPITRIKQDSNIYLILVLSIFLKKWCEKVERNRIIHGNGKHEIMFSNVTIYDRHVTWLHDEK